MFSKIPYVCHTHNTYTYVAFAANYYRHRRRRSYLVIAHEIAMRMRNRRGLFREHALFAEPKVAFCSRLRRCGGRRSHCDTSGVRSYNPARCKKGKTYSPRGRKRETRFSRYAILARATTYYVFFYQTPSRFRMIGLVTTLVLSLSELWDDSIADFVTHSVEYISIMYFLA